MRVGAGLERLKLRPATATVCVAMGSIMLLAVALFLFRLGRAELCSTNEAVEGLVVQQMVEHGELLAPVLNGHAPMFKPPLFHWTATAMARGLGVHEATEITVRLPSVVFALACVLLTMIFVQGWLGLPNAVLAGLVLLASYQFVTAARFGRVDMALTFCESLALFAFAWWLHRDADDSRQATRRTSHAPPMLYLFALALALGVLAKGPVGMVLPLVAALAALATQRRWKDLRALASPGPVLVLLVVSSGWYLACLWEGRLDVLHLQIIDENVSRLTGGISTMPPWYYVKPLLLNSAPLSLLVPIAVFQGLAMSRRQRERGALGRDLRPYVLACFWIATVLFFSIAAYKRRAYLLPLWPPAAALLVWWLHAVPVERHRRLAQGALATVCAGLIAFNAWYVPHAERSACGGAEYRRAASVIKGIVRRGEPLYIDAASTESASLLFYLDRTVPVMAGTLDNPPSGYVLAPERTWATRKASTALRPRLAVALERQRLLLLASATRAREDRRAMTMANDVPTP